MDFRVERALISVSNKSGLVDFATKLAEMGVEIVSTGGTAKVLLESGLNVRSVSDITEFPEMMGGRVKTLHPRIHGGILARRDVAGDRESMQEQSIPGIELVVCNLYPFEETIKKPDVDLAAAVEQIDIGGPAMVRAAAKNAAFVTVVVDPTDYSAVLDSISSTGTVDESTRRRLAAKAFSHTASYDTTIAEYLAADSLHLELWNHIIWDCGIADSAIAESQHL